jgi:hypothetical protein
MENISKHIDNLKTSFEGLRTGLHDKIRELQNENPNLSVEITNDFDNIFKLAKDGNLTELDKLKKKYEAHANSHSK